MNTDIYLGLLQIWATPIGPGLPSPTAWCVYKRAIFLPILHGWQHVWKVAHQGPHCTCHTAWLPSSTIEWKEEMAKAAVLDGGPWHYNARPYPISWISLFIYSHNANRSICVCLDPKELNKVTIGEQYMALILDVLIHHLIIYNVSWNMILNTALCVTSHGSLDRTPEEHIHLGWGSQPFIPETGGLNDQDTLMPPPVAHPIKTCHCAGWCIQQGSWILAPSNTANPLCSSQGHSLTHNPLCQHKEGALSRQVHTYPCGQSIIVEWPQNMIWLH